MFCCIQHTINTYEKRLCLSPTDINEIHQQQLKIIMSLNTNHKNSELTNELSDSSNNDIITTVCRTIYNEYIFNKCYQEIENLYVNSGLVLNYGNKDEFHKLIKRTAFSAVPEQLNGNMIAHAILPVKVFLPTVGTLLVVEVTHKLSIGLNSYIVPVLSLEMLQKSQDQLFSTFSILLNGIYTTTTIEQIMEKYNKEEHFKTHNNNSKTVVRIKHNETGIEFDYCAEKIVYNQLLKQFHEHPIECRFNVELKENKYLNRHNIGDLIICEVVGIENEVSRQRFKIVVIDNAKFLTKS